MLGICRNLTGVLSQRQVLELEHVDITQQNLPVNQPLEVGVAELGDSVRIDGSERVMTPSHTHYELG